MSSKNFFKKNLALAVSIDFPRSISTPRKISSLFLRTQQDKTDPILKQDCIPVGCVPPACCQYLPAYTVLGGLLLGGAWSQGCLLLVTEGCIPAYNGPDLPPVNRITDTCKNITLPQLRCGWYCYLLRPIDSLMTAG